MRKYGQHFLISPHIIESIVAAVPDNVPNVVEIGPGRGALTGRLLQKNFASFTLVEIDPEMRTFLIGRFAQLAGKIILSDFMKFDLNSLPSGPTFFVSNLPYIDAADILDKVLAWPHFAGAVFMFQKEQSRRILARDGQEEFGPLSLLTQLRARARLLLRVGKACFNPPPKVESAVLVFEPRPAFFSSEGYACFARLVKSAFAHKRKTLFNSLVLCGYDKLRVAEALARADVKQTLRAQEVSLEKFLAINRLLSL